MTYFTGMGEPKEAASRGDSAYFGSRPEYQTFNGELLASAVDGDLYFDKRSSGAERYYVPINAGDHGIEDEALLVVTHKHNGYSFERYDPEGNLVIPVYGGDPDEHGLKYAAHRAIEQALSDTPLGRVLGRDALRPVAQSLAEKFGLDGFNDYVDSDRAFTVKDEDKEGIRTALIELLSFAPEGGYPDKLGEIGAEVDGVGFAEDAEQYVALLDGYTNGFGTEVPKKRRGQAISMFSQPVLYAVAGGKGNGRGVWGRLERLMEILGVDWKDVP